MRAEGVSARTKENLADLVTEADVAAERLVVDALTRLRPEDGVVGEEGTTRPSRSGRTWVIDPVDGTYNFATGTLYWCSALALRDADAQISSGEAVLLAYNTQAAGPQAEQLRATAEASGVPVVDLAETMPADEHYTEWMGGSIDRLATALKGHGH